MWPNIIAFTFLEIKNKPAKNIIEHLFSLVMLGYMQKVSHFSAQTKKNTKFQLRSFCPEHFNY